MPCLMCYGFDYCNILKDNYDSTNADLAERYKTYIEFIKELNLKVTQAT
jgi:hypothetical protein